MRSSVPKVCVAQYCIACSLCHSDIFLGLCCLSSTEDFPLCLLLNKPHPFSLTQNRFMSIQLVAFTCMCTCFAVYFGHPHACRYKHRTKEGTISTCRNIIIIIIIFINCNWVATQWQWLLYMHTKHEIGYY